MITLASQLQSERFQTCTYHMYLQLGYNSVMVCQFLPNFLKKSVCVCGICVMYAQVCLGMCTESRGGHWMPGSVFLCFIPLRQGFSLDLELCWWLSNPSHLSISTSFSSDPTALGVQASIWASLAIRLLCLHSKCSYQFSQLSGWNSVHFNPQFHF